MLVKDLIPRVRSIYGDEESPYLISDNVLRDTKIPSGIDRFNLEFPKQFIITGTADDAIISIEPRAEEIALICLYAALAIFDGEIAKNAQRAVVITDPAGRTDATKISAELREQRKNIREELNREIAKANIGGITGDSQSTNESL
ncbi:MAG: hypothetical protein NTY10_04350 [Candidatus Omnitrophica bacterium]|nr:hypothetical protein [Candidatus Omnitrophota bacterium]